MKYGYARVSTIDQKLESQIEQLKNAGAEEIFQEKFVLKQIRGDFSDNDKEVEKLLENAEK